MKYFDWSEEKNEWLIANRGISFEMVIAMLESGDILAIENNHPPYGHQKVFILCIDNYVYEVPYVQDGDKVFLKTIYPSRKSTEKYLKNNDIST